MKEETTSPSPSTSAAPVSKAVTPASAKAEKSPLRVWSKDRETGETKVVTAEGKKK